MITPIELSSKTFKSVGLGYDKKDVDGFMKEVVSSVETMYKENVELKDKLNVLNEGIQYYKTIEKTIQKALILAEQTAEETKEAARQNAKAIEEKAKVKAALYLEDAKQQLNDIHQKTVKMIQQYEMYKTQYKNLANAQLEMLSSNSFDIEIANIDAFIKQEQEQVISEENEENENETEVAAASMETLPIENI